MRDFTTQDVEFQAISIDINSDLRVVRKTQDGFYSRYGKRAFDLLFALVLLPVIATLTIIVRLDGGPGFFGHKLTNDPRINRIGRFLRKTSLDELPQIWNVLKGEMSFVGPRPVVKEELKKYGMSVSAYLEQVPGITGLWQVSGRNDISYDQRVNLDVEYLSSRSFKQDLKIIAMTGTAVLGTTGR